MTVATNINQFSQTTLKDLLDPSVVVIHAGPAAMWNPDERRIWQRAHNIAIMAGNTLDPEIEPEQSLYVSEKQCEPNGKLYPMAKLDATKRVIIHTPVPLHFSQLSRLCLELMKQAPNAEIYRGSYGVNAESWGGLTEALSAEIPCKTERTVAGFPLIFGYEGFDNQNSYLLKGLLPTNSMCSIYGPSGSFKSFVAVSIACHVSMGKEWDGKHVEQGSVLYIVGEGGAGVARRFRAWADEYNGGRDIPNIARIPMPVFMADDQQVGLLSIATERVKQQTGLPVKLIVIDTVARCFGAGDENRATDMGAFIKGCDLIKSLTGATVLLIHHTGKSEENGARGSSALRAALDVELLVKREDSESQAVTITCTKMKDDEEAAKQSYDLKRHIVCYDDDGVEVTSLVVIDRGREPVVPGDKELDTVGNLSSNHKAMYQAIKTLWETCGGVAAWADVIQWMTGAKTWDSGNGSRWRKKLADDGLIMWDERSKTITKPD